MESLPSANDRHAVQFYGSEQGLFDTVAEFLGEGLISCQPAIVIATDSHRAGILAALSDRLIDVERARRGGDLVMLDAQELMGTFMMDDMPNPDLFEYNVGLIFDQALRVRGGGLIRAYGEVVDVLWKEGLTDSAIRLEMLWNKLATRYGFALLCGYSMGHFYKEADRMQDIRAQHSHTVEQGGSVLPPSDRKLKIGA